VEERPGEVRLSFQDGSSATADLLVGADGIHSAVRGHLVRDAPRFSGETIYRGLVPAERVPELLAEPRVQLWLGPGRHCVAYPVRAGRLVSFGATTPAGGWIPESWSAPGRPEELAAAYQGWHPDVRALIAAAGSVGRWALHDRDPVARWGRGRITLIGDAAHPMLPFLAQGANQAIEDAVVLAGRLAALPAGADPRPALRRYEQLRRPRAEEVQRRSRANTRALHLADGAEQRRRDEQLAGAGLAGQRWLYGYDAELAA
jgi:salicylate hydroxylase